MELGYWNLVVSGGGVILAIIVLFIAIKKEGSSRKRQIKASNKGILKHIKSLSERHDMVVDLLIGSDLVTDEMISKMLDKLRGESRDVLVQELSTLELATSNPVSIEDLERLVKYVAKEPTSFTIEEAEAFVKLAKELDREYANENTGILVNYAKMTERVVGEGLETREEEIE